MTKSDLIAKLVQRHLYMSVQDASIVVDSLLDSLAETLSSGGKVELRGFGIFGVKIREARAAKNPRTGEVLNIGRRRAIFFKMGKRMQELLNEPAR